MILPPDAGLSIVTTTKRCFLSDKGFDDKHGIACGDDVIQKNILGETQKTEGSGMGVPVGEAP
jgi:hypothetical protein